MYNLNNVGRNVLITGPEVLFHAATSHEADLRMIEQAIIIAEERFVKPAICKELYADFKAKKNVLVTAANNATLTTKVNEGNNGQPIVLINNVSIVNAIEEVTDTWYVQLWKEYLWKICAEAVIYIATPTNFSEYTSQGEIISQPKNLILDGQGAASASHKEVQWKMDKMLMDRIDPLLSAMHEWICDNKTNFAKYTCKKCECSEDGVSYQRKSPWIFAYDDNDKNCCNDG